MILFTVTPRFERHFRPRRPADMIPMRPLVDVLIYWCCATFGGLFGSIGIVAFIANQTLDVTFDVNELAVIVVATALSPILFVIAYRAWRKLNHDR